MTHFNAAGNINQEKSNCAVYPKHPETSHQKSFQILLAPTNMLQKISFLNLLFKHKK